MYMLKKYIAIVFLLNIFYSLSVFSINIELLPENKILFGGQKNILPVKIVKDKKDTDIVRIETTIFINKIILYKSNTSLDYKKTNIINTNFEFKPPTVKQPIPGKIIISVVGKKNLKKLLSQKLLIIPDRNLVLEKIFNVYDIGILDSSKKFLKSLDKIELPYKQINSPMELMMFKGDIIIVGENSLNNRNFTGLTDHLVTGKKVLILRQNNYTDFSDYEKSFGFIEKNSDSPFKNTICVDTKIFNEFDKFLMPIINSSKLKNCFSIAGQVNIKPIIKFQTKNKQYINLIFELIIDNNKILFSQYPPLDENIFQKPGNCLFFQNLLHFLILQKTIKRNVYDSQFNFISNEIKNLYLDKYKFIIPVEKEDYGFAKITPPEKQFIFINNSKYEDNFQSNKFFNSISSNLIDSGYIIIFTENDKNNEAIIESIKKLNISSKTDLKINKKLTKNLFNGILGSEKKILLSDNNIGFFNIYKYNKSVNMIILPVLIPLDNIEENLYKKEILNLLFTNAGIKFSGNRF